MEDESAKNPSLKKCFVCKYKHVRRIFKFSGDKWRREEVDKKIIFLKGKSFLEEVRKLKIGMCDMCLNHINNAVRISYQAEKSLYSLLGKPMESQISDELLVDSIDLQEPDEMDTTDETPAKEDVNESTGPTEDNTETTEAKEKTETSVPEEKTDTTGAIEGETGAKVEEKSSNSFSEIVLKEMYYDKTSSNLELIEQSGDKSIRVHLPVLATASPVIRSLVEKQKQSLKKLERLCIGEIKVKHWQYIVDMIYLGETSLRIEDLPELTTCVKILKIQFMIDICEMAKGKRSITGTLKLKARHLNTGVELDVVPMGKDYEQQRRGVAMEQSSNDDNMKSTNTKEDEAHSNKNKSDQDMAKGIDKDKAELAQIGILKSILKGKANIAEIKFVSQNTPKVQNMDSQRKECNCKPCSCGGSSESKLVPQPVNKNNVTHETEARYVCTKCGAKFSYGMDLFTHEEYHRSGKLALSKQDKMRRWKKVPFKMQCTYCWQFMYNASYYNKHIDLHRRMLASQKYSPHKCSKCGEEFFFKVTMDKHTCRVRDKERFGQKVQKKKPGSLGEGDTIVMTLLTDTDNKDDKMDTSGV